MNLSFGKKEPLYIHIQMGIAFLFFLTYLLIFFIRPDWLGSKWPAQLVHFLRWMHYGGMLFCLLALILYFGFDLIFKGLWTTRIAILTALLSGIVLYFIKASRHLKRIEKRYFTVFATWPMIAIGFTFIPFLGIVIMGSLFLRLIYPVEKFYYEDDKVRVQTTFYSVLSGAHIEVYRKGFIFEKHLNSGEVTWLNSPLDSVRVSYDSDSTRVWLYQFHYNEKNDTLLPCTVLALPPVK